MAHQVRDCITCSGHHDSPRRTATVSIVMNFMTVYFSFENIEKQYAPLYSDAFRVISAVATNLVGLKDDGTNVSLLSSLRSHFKTASELFRMDGMADGTFRIIVNLERRWNAVGADMKSSLLTKVIFYIVNESYKKSYANKKTTSYLMFKELKECEKIVIDALVLKADLLANGAPDRLELALETITSVALFRLVEAIPSANISLATKV